jgi:hypothetical protein
MHAQLVLSDEERADIRREVVEQLQAELRAQRAAAVEDLLSFSADEIALAKNICVENAQGLLTRHHISVEKLGPKTRRYPLRELKLIFDAKTIKGLRALREKGRAA